MGRETSKGIHNGTCEVFQKGTSSSCYDPCLLQQALAVPRSQNKATTGCRQLLSCRCNVERENVTPMKPGVSNTDPETRRQTAAKVNFGLQHMAKRGVSATLRTWSNRYVLCAQRSVFETAKGNCCKQCVPSACAPPRPSNEKLPLGLALTTCRY